METPRLTKALVAENHRGYETCSLQTVHRMRSVMDIVDEILSVDPAHFLKWTPQGRPEYIDGKVHLTDAQWERILAARPATCRHRPPARMVWGIPVVIHRKPTSPRAE